MSLKMRLRNRLKSDETACGGNTVRVQAHSHYETVCLNLRLMWGRSSVYWEYRLFHAGTIVATTIDVWRRCYANR